MKLCALFVVCAAATLGSTEQDGTVNKAYHGAGYAGHENIESIHGAAGDARRQSNVAGTGLYNSNDATRTETEDYSTQTTRHPTPSPKAPKFGGDTVGELLAAEEQVRDGQPTIQPTAFPTKQVDGCSYKIRAFPGSKKITTVEKQVGWTGPGNLQQYCNAWSCVPNAKGGGKWAKTQKHTCPLMMSKGEKVCEHTKCTYQKKVFCPKGSNCENDKKANDKALHKAHAGHNKHRGNRHGKDAKHSIYEEIGPTGIMNVHHSHKEDRRNHRCRHNLDTGDCACMCNGKKLRQDEKGFRRAIWDINRDYSGFNDYQNHREIYSSPNAHVNGGSTHDWIREDDVANRKKLDGNTVYNSLRKGGESGYVAHPHYSGKVADTEEYHYSGNTFKN